MMMQMKLQGKKSCGCGKRVRLIREEITYPLLEDEKVSKEYIHESKINKIINAIA